MRDLDTLANTAVWFSHAVPEPTTKNFHTQLGVHFEEVREMLQALSSNDPATAGMLTQAENVLHVLAQHLKASNSVLAVLESDRKDYLDALCDQIVTATGCAHMLNMDIVGGMQEVNASNWSKFVDGEPIFDENQKIQKGPDYFKADLTKFV